MKTTPTSLSVLFVIICAPVGVKTSVLVWQGPESKTFAKGKDWRGLKAGQTYIGVVFMLRNTGLAASPARSESAPSPHSSSTPACTPWDHPKSWRRLKEMWGWLESSILLGLTSHWTLPSVQFHVMLLRFLFHAWPFPLGYPPSPHHAWSWTSKSLPTRYFCTEQRDKLPAWMLLFEPCALKHGLALWLFLMHSSSRAGFSKATERNVELGPQETRAKQIYHNLL